MAEFVRCPGCGRKQPHRGVNAIYYCDRCQCQFDDDPDEGGAFFTDPEKNAQSKEEYQIRQKLRVRKDR